MAASRLRRLWQRSNPVPGATRLIRLFLPRENLSLAQDEAPPSPSVAGVAPPTVHQASATSRVQGTPQPQRARTRISECLADIRPEPVRWLWSGRIPRGRLTIIDGDPGLGKSLLTLDIAARVSRGIGFPDESTCEAGSVVVLNAEDGVADTVVPRLHAAGADRSRIHTIRAIPQPSGDRLPNIVQDAALIEMEVRRLGAVLIVIDPLNAYLPSDVNTWNDHHIRRALAPFGAVAERTGAAVVVIRHLNKRESSKAMYRGGGSIGFVAAARAAFLVAEDTADSSLRVFAAVKMNLAAKPLSLTYRIHVIDEVPRVEWVGVSEHTADELLEEPERESKPTLNRAEQFLRDVLQAGPLLAREVTKQAAELGISERTLKRAKAAIAVAAYREGYGAEGAWFWRLPNSGEPPKEGQPAHTETVAPFDGVARCGSSADPKLAALLKELDAGPEIEIDWDAPEQT